MIVKKTCLFYFLFIGVTAFYSCKKEDILKGIDKDYKTLGTSSHDLLSSNVYTSLKVEIDYMPGYAPDPAMINNLKTFLSVV